MKAIPILTLALAITAAGCGSDSPTPPTNNNPPAGNTTTPTEFRLDLKASNEKPNPISGPEASATGSGILTIRITRDPNNNIVSATADFNVSMVGFPAGSTITAAHIHTVDANTAAGILWNTGLTSGEVVLTNGAGSFSKTNVPFPSATDINQAAAIVSNPAGFYFNVHSQANAGGVIRAQMNNSGAPGQPGEGEPKPCDPADIYCTPK